MDEDYWADLDAGNPSSYLSEYLDGEEEGGVANGGGHTMEGGEDGKVVEVSPNPWIRNTNAIQPTQQNIGLDSDPRSPQHGGGNALRRFTGRNISRSLAKRYWADLLNFKGLNVSLG